MLPSGAHLIIMKVFCSHAKYVSRDGNGSSCSAYSLVKSQVNQ